MEIRAPFLEAIQSISGRTPGEKHKTLNKIAMRAAERLHDGEDFVQILSSLDVPEALEALVRIKTANILKQHDDVIVALKNEDFAISSEALKAKWFFEGTNDGIVNAEYFEKNVFPHLSFNTRSRVISNLAMFLKITTLAEQFFTAVSKMYGRTQAVPLLLACGESFILPVIAEQKIILPCKMLLRIYRKYPAVAVDYLKLSYSKDKDSKNIHEIDFYDYMEFLPKLLGKDTEAFLEICHVHLEDIRTGTKRFMGNDIFRQRQWSWCRKGFLRVLSTKSVTERLDKEEYQRLFAQSFPQFEYLCNCNEMLEYLKHCKESEKLPLIMEAYEKNYGKSLLSCEDKVVHKILGLLPIQERAKQERIKLEADDYWQTHGEKLLICYLPIDESIAAVRSELSKTFDSAGRRKLMRQLIYACENNDDREALLVVMKYFIENHSDEKEKVRYGFLECVASSFDFSTLSSEHLAILNDCIEKSYESNEIRTNGKVMRKLLENVARYNVKNNLPIEKEIRSIIELGINGWCEEWDIDTEYLRLDEKYLSMILDMVPKAYPEGHEVWRNNGAKLVERLIRCIYDFNARNEKTKNGTDRISMKDHSWLLGKCKALLHDRGDGANDKMKNKIMDLLRANEKNLYDLWLKDAKEVCDYTLDDILEILVKDPQRVLDDWKEYLRNAQKAMPARKAKLFIRRSRWYQDIPMNFVEKCLEDLRGAKNENTFVTLALLLDEPFFIKVIEPYVPTGSEADTTNDSVQETQRIIRTIPHCMNEVNPPVSLDVSSSFCIGDFRKTAMHFLTSIGKRVSVPKVISFAKSLADGNVPLKNHAILLAATVSSLEESQIFLMDSWKCEKNAQIREVIFTQVHSVFAKTPNPQTWQMVEECFTELNADDESSFLYFASELSSVPNEYISEYVQLVSRTISKLERNGYDPDECSKMICRLIRNISSSICTLLSEDYCRELLTEHLFAFDNSEIAAAGEYFAIDSYIPSAGDKLETRLNVICEHLKESVKTYWDVPHPECSASRIFPMTARVHSFIGNITGKVHLSAINFEKLLQTFVSVVPPAQDPVSYLSLIFCVQSRRVDSNKDFGIKVGQNLPDIIESLSPESMRFIADQLIDFINCYSVEEGYPSKALVGAIEGLIEVGTDHACMIAAIMLPRAFYKEVNEQYFAFINALHERRHNGLSCVLHEYRNTSSRQY